MLKLTVREIQSSSGEASERTTSDLQSRIVGELSRRTQGIRIKLLRNDGVVRAISSCLSVLHDPPLADRLLRAVSRLERVPNEDRMHAHNLLVTYAGVGLVPESRSLAAALVAPSAVNSIDKLVNIAGSVADPVTSGIVAGELLNRLRTFDFDDPYSADDALDVYKGLILIEGNGWLSDADTKTACELARFHSVMPDGPYDVGVVAASFLRRASDGMTIGPADGFGALGQAL